MDQWMGNVAWRFHDLQAIPALDYHELRYWNSWHMVMTDAEKAPPKPKVD